MSAKQSNTGDTVKRLCIYSVLVAACMVVGYIESLFELSFIAPGIKIGLSNSVACVLLFSGDIKGAFAVNVSRIVLSALLFGSPVSFCFSLAGGIVSMVIMAFVKKSRHLSVLGVSAIGGAVHNTVQCAVGSVFVGKGVVFYLPMLLFAGVVCGLAVGVISSLVLKRVVRR